MKNPLKNEIQVAKVLIENKEGKFLAVKEHKTGQWELPGGKIEEESITEAARREVLEEVNLEITGLEEVVRVEVEDEDCVNCWILHTESFSGEIELFEEELKDWKWVNANEYRDMDWHADAGYAIPAMRFLDDYLD